MAPVRWILIQRFVFKIWLFSCLLSRQVQNGRDWSRKCWKILYVNSLQPAWEWCTDMAMIRIRNGGVWRPISNWWCRCEENGCWECVRPAHVIYCSRKINQVIFVIPSHSTAPTTLPELLEFVLSIPETSLLTCSSGGPSAEVIDCVDSQNDRDRTHRLLEMRQSLTKVTSIDGW